MTENLRQLLRKSTASPGALSQTQRREHASDPIVGTVLGQDYEILECLGQGAMAKVYKARQRTLDRLVAIKILITKEPDMVARFAHEIKIHSRLQHVNIVDALDCITDTSTGQTFFVMEYLQGQSIQQLVGANRGGLKREEDIIHILRQIAGALEHAHRQGVIHRDLKPANMLLIERDEQVVIKVVDFGLAKLQEQIQKFTKTGHIVGSPLYMSPEQCIGKELDARSDVYSLGLVAYELVCGEPPYAKSKSLIDVMHCHCDPKVKPDAIQFFNEEIRMAKRLESILFTALETKKEDRFQSARAFCDALKFWYQSIEKGLSDESIEAIPIEKGERSPVLAVPKEFGESEVDGKVYTQASAWQIPELVTTHHGGGWGIVSGIELAYIPQCESVIGRNLKGRYQIGEVLGEGGMSVVYKAHDLEADRMAAIKTLKFMQQDLCSRFHREIAIHSELKHPNIVKAYDQFRLPNGQSFFVMELLDGTILEDYLERERQVADFNDICSILAQICDALEFAHDAGVIHRDLKPGNIMVIEQQGSLWIKVLDFGLAKIEADLQRLTKTGVLVGSPAYMSPEHCLGKPLTSQSDLYSLGVLAYEMIAGAFPFKANTDIGMIQAHSDTKLAATPISECRQDLPALNELDALLMKVLSKNVEERFESVDDFRQALDTWWQAAGQPCESSPFKQRRRRRLRTPGRKVEIKVHEVEKVEAPLAGPKAEELSSLVDKYQKSKIDTLRAKSREPMFNPRQWQMIRLVAITVLVFVALGSFVAWLSAQPRKLPEQEVMSSRGSTSRSRTSAPDSALGGSDAVESKNAQTEGSSGSLLKGSRSGLPVSAETQSSIGKMKIHRAGVYTRHR